jgi:arginine N-succinyltransferase
MSSTILIRPVKLEDLDSVYQLAAKTGPGMTSLPADKTLLTKKIQDSINSFMIEPTEARDESYRLVLELDDELIGIAAISARIGGYEPFYSYEIKRARHVSESLGVDKEVEYLELKKEYDGPSLIGSLFLDPEYRSKGFGRVLSLARFFLMANFPNRFKDSVIAEMRGVIDQSGQSPFWNGTVRNFFDMDFTRADFLSITDKGFIADLMPHYPLYIPLLKDSTQEVIAKVHEKTKPALHFLLGEGFLPDGHVDIFDAGPRIQAKSSEIKTIKESIRMRVIDIQDELFESAKSVLISNLSIDFRLTQANVLVKEEGLVIDTKTAELLKIKCGDELRYLYA